MSTVLCAKYGKELQALTSAPFPGEAGEKILNKISAQAWGEWLEMQTMFINENQLNMMDPEARTFLAERRDEFLFEGGEKLNPPTPI
jgi:Fe-S cluster biosynthesis and repair protein YggX|tara:strand:+ start:946 stop:1206 length:261 start_codon:yes stop_codon:yes gene_type:complete